MGYYRCSIRLFDCRKGGKMNNQSNITREEMKRTQPRCVSRLGFCIKIGVSTLQKLKKLARLFWHPI